MIVPHRRHWNRASVTRGRTSVDLRTFVPRGSEPADRLFSRQEDVQRMPEQVDRHVRVEPVQLIKGDEEAPLFRKTVGDRDDLREVPHLLEELLPLRDQLVLWELYEHILSPTRRGGSLGKGHIPLRLPSTDARPVREFRSDRFHWNPNGSERLTRRARSRTLGIARSRARGRGSRRTRDASSSALDPRRRQNTGAPRTSRARVPAPIGPTSRRRFKPRSRRGGSKYPPRSEGP